jgi:pyrroloquinoline quinone biosynthesis protein B
VIIRVLGSSAGGGFPQWNCWCGNCEAVRQKKKGFEARTQSSIAVSLDGDGWVLFNVSPDIRQQIHSWPEFARTHSGVRRSAIHAVVLTDSQIDHASGLLLLREGRDLPIHCTDEVANDLTSGFPVFRILDSFGGVQRNRLSLGEKSIFFQDSGGLEVTAISVQSNAPPYSPYRDHPLPGHNIALFVTDRKRGGSLLYAPNLLDYPESIINTMKHADCLLVDGTFWSSQEMAMVGVTRSSEQMGHRPLSGENGSLKILNQFAGKRRILTHINNTNPILDESSPQRVELNKSSIEVAFDGMQWELK